MFKNQKGFTLIELLVVIAIIGILSSVVLASLNTARNRGADAAIKADLSGARAAAELYYDTNSNYGAGAIVATCSVTPPAGVMTDVTMQRQIDDAYSKAGNVDGKCGSSNSTYVVAMPLKTDTTNNFWCIDHLGSAKQITAAQYAALTIAGCP
jgi:prepilin-type N-terminal cleavage/methylation domain-containing protein